jgi:two-component system response regulator (stage 0 sporulation protein F)
MRLAHPPGRLSVLLAEDDADLRAMLSMVLRNEGHRVTEFSNGGDLEAYLQNVLPEGPPGGPPLFVVADQRLPERDGLTVMRIMEERGCRPPFILMTAFADPQTRAAARRMGATAVLDKPFDFEDLCGLIRNFAHRAGPPA